MTDSHEAFVKLSKGFIMMPSTRGIHSHVEMEQPRTAHVKTSQITVDNLILPKILIISVPAA